MKPNHHRAILEVRNAECGMRSGAARIAVAAVLFYSALCIPHSALGAWVTATNTHNIIGHVLTTKITFTPTNDVLIANGGLSAGPAITTNIVNGCFTNWLDGGNYTVTFPLLPFRRPFLIAVPGDTNSYDITSLMNPPVTYTYTNRLVGIASQVRPGTNVTFTTNNAGSVTENVTVSVSTTGLVTRTFFEQAISGNAAYVVSGAGYSPADGIYNFQAGVNYTNGNFYLYSNAVPNGTWAFYGEEGIYYTNDNALAPIGNWGAVNPRYAPAPTVLLGLSNQFALKADLANLTIAATNSGAYVAATNGTAYNLTIASGNGGGLTNVLASYVSGTLTNNTTGSAASLSSVITAAALASNTPFAPGSLLMANNGVNQNWSTNLLWNSSVLTIRDSLITNTWTLTSTGTVWGVSGARAEASMVVNTNSTLYGINTISTVSAFTASVGGASYAFDTADFRHSSGAQDLGRTSIPWGTGYFRNVSVRTNLFVTNSVYVVGGSYNGNGGGLTNLQATNIVFQDKVWSGTEVNDEGNAIIELNNGYQRYEWGANYFTITGITPAATGKPRWTSFKLLNTSLATMTLTISISNARAIGSASPFTIPDGKVAWITIHDDGQGTDWSITYAVAIEP